MNVVRCTYESGYGAKYVNLLKAAQMGLIVSELFGVETADIVNNDFDQIEHKICQDSLYSVRSSFGKEDTTSSSAAGIYSSYIGIRGWKNV